MIRPLKAKNFKKIKKIFLDFSLWCNHATTHKHIFDFAFFHILVHCADDPPEEEPKGFKPLQEGKSFIPIKDQVTFKPYSDAPSSTPSTPKTPLNGDPSSLTAAMTNSSSVPPTYPRPINPLILEAMYRMQTQRQSPFGGFYGGSTAAGAPRPPYPFPPSLMAAAGLNGSPFGHSRYPGSDLFHPLHHHASHGGHPICNKPKDR